jgi:hypothetical protein
MGVVFRCNQPTRYMTATGAAKRAKRKANNINSFSMATSCQVTRRSTHILVQNQWEKIKPKGRCEYHASGDGEGHSLPCSGNLHIAEEGDIAMTKIAVILRLRSNRLDVDQAGCNNFSR